MGKIKYKHILIGLIFLITVTFSVSVTFAIEDTTSSKGYSAGDSVNSLSANSSNLNVKSNQTNSKPSKVSQDSVVSASKTVNNYVAKNKKLPNSVVVSGYTFSMPEFLYLMSKTISNKNNKINSPIVIKYDIKNPTNPTGTGSKGKIYSVYYYKYAVKVVNDIDKSKKVPNYIVTAAGNKLQYQSIVFLFAKILSSTDSNGNLPYYVSVNIRKTTSFNKYLPIYTRPLPSSNSNKTLGKNDKGYVELLSVFGNPSSKIKIAYIIGVHPLESNSHKSLYNNLLAKSKSLKYKYYIYKITVTKDASDYVYGRMNGQLLAQKYVLPHIKANKYNLVIDVHSNQGTRGGNYQKTNFIFAPLNSASSKKIANKIISKISGLSYYYPASQTSPHYITNPLVQAGIKTIVYETYLYESQSTTNKFMKQLISNVDVLSL